MVSRITNNCSIAKCEYERLTYGTYCVYHQREYMRQYRKNKHKQFLKVGDEPKTVSINTGGNFWPKENDIKEGESLPITWSDATRKEWSTRYHFDNWKFKGLRNNFK